MTMYGIKTCSTVGKARKFLKEHGKAYDFVDYKTEQVGEEKIRAWLEHVDIKTLFNTKGKKYRDLGLKDLDLDDAGKIAWMAKENYLIKRPVIEHDGRVIVGYDEVRYREQLL